MLRKLWARVLPKPRALWWKDERALRHDIVAASDNKCGTASLNIGSGPTGDTFNPKSTFGHMHAGTAEWWIVQVGQIWGRFKNAGEFHTVEGDVLYAAPMRWHEMAAEAPSGPSVRLALGGYNLNMQNTEHRRAAREGQ